MKSEVEIADWDLFYLGMAKYIAEKRSKDPSTQTGAVIVRPNKTQASIGFNGFPHGMKDTPALYANRDEKYSRIVHCEMNALLLSAEKVNGYTLYTWPFASCDRCAVHMIQAGIARFVYPELTEDKKERWEPALTRTVRYFRETDREWLEVPHKMLEEYLVGNL